MYGKEKEYVYIIKFNGKTVRKGIIRARSPGDAKEQVLEMLFDEAEVETNCVAIKVFFKDFEVLTYICKDWRDIVRSALDKLKIHVVEKEIIDEFKEILENNENI